MNSSLELAVVANNYSEGMAKALDDEIEHIHFIRDWQGRME